MPYYELFHHYSINNMLQKFPTPKQTLAAA